MLLDFRYRALLRDASQDSTPGDESPMHRTLALGIWLQPAGATAGDKGNLLDNFGTRSE